MRDGTSARLVGDGRESVESAELGSHLAGERFFHVAEQRVVAAEGLGGGRGDGGHRRRRRDRRRTRPLAGGEADEQAGGRGRDDPAPLAAVPRRQGRGALVGRGGAGERQHAAGAHAGDALQNRRPLTVEDLGREGGVGGRVGAGAAGAQSPGESVLTSAAGRARGEVGRGGGGRLVEQRQAEFGGVEVTTEEAHQE